MRKLLIASLKDKYFKFNNTIYKHIDGLAMGSQLSPIIPNIFLNFLEVNHLNLCPPEFKPQFYRRYVDDIFILFINRQQAINFLNYFNPKHWHITFTMEEEQNDRLSFLDAVVSWFDNYFVTSVFRKLTFTWLGTNYFSNVYPKYKISSILFYLEHLKSHQPIRCFTVKF